MLNTKLGTEQVVNDNDGDRILANWCGIDSPVTRAAGRGH